MFASDYLKHVKEPVLTFLGHLLQNLPPSVQTVRVFTDNATAQFKNRFVMRALLHMQNIFCVDIQWNFLAAQHGKGVCDGLGATIKQFVFNRVKSNRVEVTNAKQFVEVARNSSILTTEITFDDIETFIKNNNLQSVINNAKCVPRISDMHCFYYEQNKLISKKTSK